MGVISRDADQNAVAHDHRGVAKPVEHRRIWMEECLLRNSLGVHVLDGNGPAGQPRFVAIVYPVVIEVLEYRSADLLFAGREDGDLDRRRIGPFAAVVGPIGETVYAGEEGRWHVDERAVGEQLEYSVGRTVEQLGKKGVTVRIAVVGQEAFGGIDVQCRIGPHGIGVTLGRRHLVGSQNEDSRPVVDRDARLAGCLQFDAYRVGPRQSGGGEDRRGPEFVASTGVITGFPKDSIAVEIPADRDESLRRIEVDGRGRQRNRVILLHLVRTARVGERRLDAQRIEHVGRPTCRAVDIYLGHAGNGLQTRRDRHRVPIARRTRDRRHETVRLLPIATLLPLEDVRGTTTSGGRHDGTITL